MNIRLLYRGWLLAACMLHSFHSLATPTEDHRAAVALAREGHTGEALRALEALHHRQPSAALVYDLIAVAHWHADDDAAIVWARQLPSTENLPDYALQALARSHRNLGQFEPSLSLYRQCLQRWPNTQTCALGEALVLAELGQTAAALAAIDTLIDADPDNPELYGHRGYINRSGSRWLAAADDYQRAAEGSTQASPYRRLQILSLLDLDAPIQAAVLAERYPEALDAEMNARLAGDLAARHINWIDLPHLDPQLREERIARAHQSLAAAKTISLTPARQRFDRLLLADREHRPEAVLAMAESMRADGLDLPDYVLNVVAGAHLQLRQPHETLAVIDQLSPTAASDFNVQVMRIYALEESGDYPAAVQVADELMAREPRWRHYPGLLQPQPNPRRLRAERLAAMMRAYGNQLPEAEQRLDPLVDNAPLSAEARADRAAVYGWRGWPLAAQEEYRIILSHTPDHTDAHLGLANLYAQQGEFALAEQHWQALAPEADTRRLRRAREDFDRLYGWALDQRSGFTDSTGDTRGSREWRAGVELRTPVLGEGWRGYVGSDIQRADFPEGRGRERVDRLGVTRRQPHWEWRAGLHRADVNANGNGLHGELRWLPHDHGYLGLAVSTQSPQTPLRGRNQDVSADLLNLSGGWRWSESRHFDASASVWDFSDGNRRKSLQAAFAERLYVDHQWQLDGRVDAWASRNREGNFAYYNPREDASLTLGLDIHQRVFRHYHHQLRHRLQINAGVYYQQGYGSAPIGDIAWRPRWDINAGLAIEAGIALQTRVYDGQREQHLGFNLDLDWRWH